MGDVQETPRIGQTLQILASACGQVSLLQNQSPEICLIKEEDQFPLLCSS